MPGEPVLLQSLVTGMISNRDEESKVVTTIKESERYSENPGY